MCDYRSIGEALVEVVIGPVVKRHLAETTVRRLLDRYGFRDTEIRDLDSAASSLTGLASQGDGASDDLVGQAGPRGRHGGVDAGGQAEQLGCGIGGLTARRQASSACEHWRTG